MGDSISDASVSPIRLALLSFPWCLPDEHKSTEKLVRLGGDVRFREHCGRTRLFTRVRGETVWKIAEGISLRLSGDKRRPNRDSFDPCWSLSEPPFGTYPEFPNSFGREILRSSNPASCITSPLCGWRMGDPLARAPNPQPYMLWCCIFMHLGEYL